MIELSKLKKAELIELCKDQRSRIGNLQGQQYRLEEDVKKERTASAHNIGTYNSNKDRCSKLREQLVFMHYIVFGEAIDREGTADTEVGRFLQHLNSELELITDYYHFGN